jgi:TIR domain
MAVEVLLCYAHKDERYLNQLKIQLTSIQREGLVKIWHDRDISAGNDWDHEIDEHLNTAQIILLLVSPDFIYSKYCYSIEMKRAIERDKLGEVCAIPIILRPTDWHNTPLGKLQALPKDGKPITKWRSRDDAFLDVARGLRKVIEEISRSSLYEASPVPRRTNLMNQQNQSNEEERIHTTSNKGADEEALAKLRDEMQRQREADSFLLEAHKFASSLMQKDELINKAVELWPPYQQKEYRQLGLEMSAAVIDGVDHIKWKSMKAAGYTFEAPLFQLPLEEGERTFFTDHAIRYLTESVLNADNSDAQGLLYLACMYGYCQQYEEMMMVIDKASQISQIVQTMKAEYRERPMVLILVGACGSDQTKIDQLREKLNLPRTTKQFFCDYITKEFPLNPNYRYGEFIKWVAVRRADASGISDSIVISISPVYPSDEGTVYAFSLRPDGGKEDIVLADKKVPIEELYRRLSSLFILFCPID